MKSEKELIRTLLFYAEMLSDKNSSDKFLEEYGRLSLTFDYYTRAIEEAREYMTNQK
jgi:hypothetical protein